MAEGAALFRPTSPSLLPVEPHRGVALAVVGPALAHLDEEEEVDAAVELLLELGAGAGADALHLAALAAEHDRLLALALDEDRLRDLDAAVLELLPSLGLDGRGVGQLVMELEEDLLAGDLGGEKSLRRVGELILGKEPRPLGHGAREMAAEIVDAAAGEPR